MLNKKNGKEKDNNIIIKNLQSYVNSDEIYQKYKNKQLKEISDFDRFCIKHCDDIEELIREYECLYILYKNEKKTNQELIKKVKRLEEQVEYDKTHIYTPMTIQLNFIPKQKIEDKIEELKEENYQISLESKVVFDTGIMKNNLKIQVLQELLQESEDK